MPKHWFFYSYARDRETSSTAGAKPVSDPSYQEQFFADLAKEFRIRFGEPPGGEQLGFVDVAIPTGQIWRDRLGEAINTCRCFLFIQEPTYFQREWCGKEWALFRSRIEAYLRTQLPGTERPPLIFPILWVPTVVELPHLASEIQNCNRDLGKAYASVGLLDLMRLDKYKDDYIEFKGKLANAIYNAIQNHVLPPLPTVPPFEEVSDAFRPPVPQATVVRPVVQTAAGARTPSKCAQFIYVAACRDEIEREQVRRIVEAYGNEADEWVPFYPEPDDPAFCFAQLAATSRKFKYERLPLGPDLIARLTDAREARKIVVLLVDCWSLKIEKYKEAMVDYVGRNFINSLVIVPWDKADETSEDAEELQQLLNATFYELTEMGNKRFRIVSSERFIEELDAALDDRLDAILKAPGTTFRKVLGAGPRSKPTFSAARTW